MRAEPRTLSAARHRVPLIAQSPGVEAQWESVARCPTHPWMFRCDEAATPIAREERAGAEETRFAWFASGFHGPHHRVEPVIVIVGERRETTQVEVAPTVILEGRQRRMLAKNIGRLAVGKRALEAEALGHFADDPPIGLCLAGARQERSLARNTPLRIGDGAVLLAPGGRRQEHMRARLD